MQRALTDNCHVLAPYETEVIKRSEKVEKLKNTETGIPTMPLAVSLEIQHLSATKRPTVG